MGASEVEQTFQRELLSEGVRVDGRSFDESREISFKYGSEYGNVEVKLGNTHLVVQVSATIKVPKPTAPFEGLFHITTDISSMASPKFENGTQSPEKIMVSRMVEKSIVRSNAVDLESLCIVSGKRCWMVRVDVHYLDYDGGLIDASCAGVIAALLHFRLPDTSIDGENVIVHSIDERPPVPLSVLHVPISSTWVFVALAKTENDDDDDDKMKRTIEGDQSVNEDDDEMNVDTGNNEAADDTALKIDVGVRKVALLDPTAAEQDLSHGEIIITANKNREICQITKAGGMLLSSEDVCEYAETAFNRALRITTKIQDELKRDFETRNKGNLGTDFSQDAINVRAVD